MLCLHAPQSCTSIRHPHQKLHLMLVILRSDYPVTCSKVFLRHPVELRFHVDVRRCFPLQHPAEFSPTTSCGAAIPWRRSALFFPTKSCWVFPYDILLSCDSPATLGVAFPLRHPAELQFLGDVQHCFPLRHPVALWFPRDVQHCFPLRHHAVLQFPGDVQQHFLCDLFTGWYL